MKKWLLPFCIAFSLLSVGALTVSLNLLDGQGNGNAVADGLHARNLSIIIPPILPMYLSSDSGKSPAYHDGYEDGFKAAVSTADERRAMFPVLTAVFLLGAVAGSALMLGILAWRQRRVNRIHSALPLLLIAGVFLSACVGKTSRPLQVAAQSAPTVAVSEPPAPMPPLSDKGKGTVIALTSPYTSSASRAAEPDVLRDLLDMKGTAAVKDNAVKQLRPSAIREAAHMVTLQSAIAWRYGKLLDEVYRHSAVMDSAFNFAPLVMTQGEALILPPVLARAGASMRIEENGTATAATSTFELLQNAKYISVVPHWRTYLMADDFPQPEAPNPSVLPKNSEERGIWQDAVREAWAQGMEEADQLFADNVARMVRDYKGIMLYHLLTAQHLISDVKTAQADLGMNISDSGNRLNIGQQVFRITAPSAFVIPQSETKHTNGRRHNGRNK